VPVVRPDELIHFPETAEGYVAKVRWYSFQFLVCITYQQHFFYAAPITRFNCIPSVYLHILIVRQPAVLTRHVGARY
jgi:hypothetical protein